MYVRMVSVQVPPEKMDELIEVWRNAIIPAAKTQQGWQGGGLLVDRKKNKAVIQGLWATEADVAATDQGSDFATQQQARLAGIITGPPVVESFEIFGEV